MPYETAPGVIPSVIVNLAIVLCTAGAIRKHGRNSPMKVVLRYFTALSNILCAIAALAVVIGRLSGPVPQAILVLKYISTCAVTVTLLTVLAFLGPTIGYRLLLTGPDLWLHLVCPVLAIVSLLAWDKPRMGIGAVLLGALPVAAYGLLYLYKVILAPVEKRWDDFYGFNRSGKWPVSFAAMAAGTLLVSWLLWL